MKYKALHLFFIFLKMPNSDKPKTGKLTYVNGNHREILAADKPFALLQSLKKQKIAQGIPASKLKISY